MDMDISPIDRVPDKVDFQGTKYWYCGVHDQWWTSFCPKCDPGRERIDVIVASVVAAIIVCVVFVPIILAVWSRS